MNYTLVTKPSSPAVIHSMTPQVEIHRNCVYVPCNQGNFWESREWGLYDHRGHILESAAFRSRPFMLLTGQNPTCLIDTTGTGDAPEERYFYAGNMIAHYGHFLCSSMARLWALQDHRGPSIPVIGHGAGGPVNWFSWSFTSPLLEAAGLEQSDFSDFNEPVRIRELVIPHPSFIELNLAYKEYARAACIWGDRLSGTSEKIPFDYEMIYISKSKYRDAPDGLSNETEVVDEIERLGVPVFYPEKLSLSEQVSLFRRARRILGQSGSAFHTSIMCEARPDQVFVQINVSRTHYSTNHALMDGASGHRSFYLYFEGVNRERPGANPGLELLDPRGAARDLVDFARKAEV